MTAMNNELKGILLKLKPLHQTAFTASCAERLYPNYVAFSREANWGDPDELRNALDAVWGHISGRTLSQTAVKDMVARCDPFIPDTDEIQTDHVSDGLDAGAAVIEALLSCVDSDPRHAINASVVTTDTVDRYIQVTEDLDYSDPEFEEKIAKHPMMVREYKKQESDLRLLQQSTTIDKAVVEKLRRVN